MKLSKDFALHEFACNDKHRTPVPPELIPNVELLAKNLQVLRDYFGKPIHINSGYRTKAYNNNLKPRGARRSQHLLAKAADIVVEGVTPTKVAATIDQLIREGKMRNGGLGRYARFTHYDVRDLAPSRKPRWPRWGKNALDDFGGGLLHPPGYRKHSK
jgi:uncharacterized protein YcbK (DUF882 family)